MNIYDIMAHMGGHFVVGYNLLNDYWYGYWERGKVRICATDKLGENAHDDVFRDLHDQWLTRATEPVESAHEALLREHGLHPDYNYPANQRHGKR